jgi:hypothetical protein
MPSVEPLLFAPDDLPGQPIDESLTIRPTAERPLSKEERAFNRAVAKVQALRSRFDEEKRQLDRALLFHATELRPRLERVTALRTALVRESRRRQRDRLPLAITKSSAMSVLRAGLWVPAQIPNAEGRESKARSHERQRSESERTGEGLEPDRCAVSARARSADWSLRRLALRAS